MSSIPPSVDEMHARRFERVCADGIAERLRRSLPEDLASARKAAKREARAALGRADARVFVGACQVWRELQPLPGADNSRFAKALVAQERFEEAHDVLVSSRAQPHGHDYFHHLSLALTGMGRLGPALAAAIKAKAALLGQGVEVDLEEAMADSGRAPTPLERVARQPGYQGSIERQFTRGKHTHAANHARQYFEERAETLIGALTRAATAQAGARPPADWAGTRRLIETYLLLGLAPMATQSLTAALGKPEAQAEIDGEAAFALAAGAAPRLDVPTLMALTKALEPFCMGKAERLLMGQVRVALKGDPAADAAPAVGPGRVRNEVRSFLALACAAAGRWKIAIDLLGRLTDHQRRGTPYLAELARCTGEETLRRVRLDPQPRSPRRIFDLFPYNGEQQILEIKLNEMAGWVDRFVIVESRQTFAGLPKPLQFEAARARFTAWADRIDYVVVDAFPDHVASPWARNFHQRDEAIRGIAGACAPDDLVLLTDVDEIVDRRAVEPFAGEFAGLAMQTFRYFLNYRQAQPSEAPGSASVWKARYLQDVGSSYARNVLAPWMTTDRLQDAGWRFTAIADPSVSVAGVRPHPELETGGRRASTRDQAGAADLIEALRRGRFEAGWERWEIDERFPDFVRRNLQPLAALIL